MGGGTWMGHGGHFISCHTLYIHGDGKRGYRRGIEKRMERRNNIYNI
jgi:hypothetical protein